MNDSALDLQMVSNSHSSAKRTALEETTAALAYLIREWETYGKLDHINMAHAYSAAAVGHAVLALHDAQCLHGGMTPFRSGESSPRRNGLNHEPNT